MFTPMESPVIARSSSWGSPPRGIPWAGSCDYLSERGGENGFLLLGLSQCCLAKTVSPGARGLPGNTSRVFESKSEMAARPQEFSRLARFLDTIRTCLRELTIHMIR